MDERRLPVFHRFVERVSIQPDGCWRWTGCLDAAGYGRLGRKPAHRISYELFNGTVPKGQPLDHLCRRHWCVNPEHLELVSPAENFRRGEHQNAIVARSSTCLHGHLRTPENVYWRKDRPGKWNCRVCTNERKRARTARLRERRAA